MLPQSGFDPTNLYYQKVVNSNQGQNINKIMLRQILVDEEQSSKQNYNGIIHTIEEMDEKYEVESTPCNTLGNAPTIKKDLSSIRLRGKVSPPRFMEPKRSTSSCPTDPCSPIPSQHTPLLNLKPGFVESD